MDYPERVEKAANLALKRNRQRSSVQRRKNMGLDITKSAGDYDVSVSDVAKELSRRRAYKKQMTKQPKKPKAFDGAVEMCRECGQKLEHGDSQCPLCGADTSFIWGGLTMEGIIVHLKKLCESGLKVSERIKLRKAIRELSRDMMTNSSKYSGPINKKLMVEIKRG